MNGDYRLNGETREGGQLAVRRGTVDGYSLSPVTHRYTFGPGVLPVMAFGAATRGSSRLAAFQELTEASRVQGCAYPLSAGRGERTPSFDSAQGHTVARMDAPATKRSDSYGGHSIEQRSSERRNRIMTAASHLFGSQEYESVTVAEICADAKVSKRYFYDHFVDRSDLLLTVHREHNDWLLNSAKAAAPQVSPSLEKFIRPILRKLVGLLYEHTERARIIYINAPRMEPQRRALLRAEADQFGELLRPFVDPRLDGPNYTRTLLALVAGATEVIIDWVARDMPEDPTDLADHLCWLCCAVLSCPSPPHRA